MHIGHERRIVKCKSWKNSNLHSRYWDLSTIIIYPCTTDADWYPMWRVGKEMYIVFPWPKDIGECCVASVVCIAGVVILRFGPEPKFEANLTEVRFKVQKLAELDLKSGSAM